MGSIKMIAVYFVFWAMVGQGAYWVALSLLPSIPLKMRAWNVLDITGDAAEIQTRKQTFVAGGVLLFLAFVLGSQMMATIPDPAASRFLAHHWHALTTRHVLGSTILLLAGGLLRAAFLKNYPPRLLPLLIWQRYRQEDEIRAAIRILRTQFALLALFIGGTGAILYYNFTF